MTANGEGLTAGDGLPGGWDDQTVRAVVARAASPTFEDWWSRLEHAGFCASPIHLRGHDPATGQDITVMGRCKNRRASVCPSCSQLYAGDTWQLVHAGIVGGHHGLPETIGEHPAIFATLTAPSFGPVHTARRDGGICHPHRKSGETRCPHGRPLQCGQTHRVGDDLLGKPLCGECYDYLGHVLFTWHASELWHRFTIRLRRLLARHLRDAGDDPTSVRISYLKVVEQQRRLIPHFHAVIRLDAPTARDELATAPAPSLGAEILAGIVAEAVKATALSVPAPGGYRILGFGAQTDIQALDHRNKGADEGRKVAAYLAKYVTKSVAETGIGPRRISDQAVPFLNIDEHTRRVLETITALARTLPEYAGMLAWLHTLGYRGHITSKTRIYSTTMGALRAQRARWRKSRTNEHGQAEASMPGPDSVAWEFVAAGHATSGDRLLALTAAIQAAEARRAAREDLSSRDSDED